MGRYANFQPLPIDLHLGEIAQLLVERKRAQERSQQQALEEKFRRDQLRQQKELQAEGMANDLMRTDYMMLGPKNWDADTEPVSMAGTPPEFKEQAAMLWQGRGVDEPPEGLRVGRRVLIPDPAKFQKAQLAITAAETGIEVDKAQMREIEARITKLTKDEPGERLKTVTNVLETLRRLSTGTATPEMGPMLILANALMPDKFTNLDIEKLQGEKASPEVQKSANEAMMTLMPFVIKMTKDTYGGQSPSGVEKEEPKTEIAPKAPPALPLQRPTLKTPVGEFEVPRDPTQFWRELAPIYAATKRRGTPAQAEEMYLNAIRTWNSLYLPVGATPFPEKLPPGWR